MLKALADNNRISILFLLSKHEMAVCEVMDALKMSQPAVSHHLKILKQAGLIRDSREGKMTYYSLDIEMFNNCMKVLENEIFSVIRSNLKNGISCSRIRSSPDLCEKIKKNLLKS
ncbi:ArsR/SmtB family transcription factor [Thermoanaerobacter kivui]|uniref:ArsR/SmtB family transcription factor n=1 Tax=Thermoanaerobacter kivui TaxID=2325 RepID=UPI002286D4E8